MYEYAIALGVAWNLESIASVLKCGLSGGVRVLKMRGPQKSHPVAGGCPVEVCWHAFFFNLPRRPPPSTLSCDRRGLGAMKSPGPLVPPRATHEVAEFAIPSWIAI